jgi:hypothetical protein
VILENALEMENFVDMSPDSKVSQNKHSTTQTKTDAVTDEDTQFQPTRVLVQATHFPKTLVDKNTTASPVCKVCEKQFKNKHTLAKHIKCFHNEPEEEVMKFGCDRCDYVGKSQPHLERHILNIHLGIFHIRCLLCDFVTGRKSALKQHVLSVHAKGKNLERQLGDYRTIRPGGIKKIHDVRDKTPCDYAAAHSNNLSAHIKGVHDKIKDKKIVNCAEASKAKIKKEKALQRSEASKRIRASYKKFFDLKCPHCDYTSAFLGNIIKHAKKEHEISGFKCPDYRTAQPRRILEHVKEVHDNIEKQINIFNKKSSHCNSTTSQAGTLKQHNIAVHDDFQEKKCPHCDFRTKLPDLSSHIKYGHEWKCLLCDYIGSQPKHMSSHIKTKHGKDNKRGWDKKCPHCDYKFSN